MALIKKVPRQHFSGQRNLVESTHEQPRSLWSILNEIIDGVNSGSVQGADLLVAEFDHTAWVTGWVSLGISPADRSIGVCVVDVLDPFNGGALCTVGDPVAQGRLQSASQNDLEFENRYHTEPDYIYTADQQLYVYFSGAPNKGRGRVLIYLS